MSPTMNAIRFTPNKVTVNMDPVDLLEDDGGPASGEREVRDEWIVRTEDGQVGPVSSELIVRGLNLGRVPESAQIARPGSETWYPVTHIVPPEIDPCGLEEQLAPPVAMVPVVPVGQPEFEWPDSFAPKSESVAPEAPAPEVFGKETMLGQPIVDPGAVQAAEALTPAPMSAPPMSAPPMSASPMSAPAPSSLQPVVVPTMAQPMMAQPAQPTMAQPMVAQPMVAQPMVAQPFAPGASAPTWQAPQAQVPTAPVSFPEEPVALPTEERSPALLGFAATLGIAAFVAVGYALIQVLL